MSAPALVFALITLMALVTLAMRRRKYLPFLIGGVSAAFIGLFVLYAPLDSAISPFGLPLRLNSGWQVLGRPLNLDTQDRATVGYLFLVGALFFSFGWAITPGRSFIPVGFIALGLLAGALTIEPFLFAAIFLELAAMACVLILIPPGARNERGILNLLILYSMAMMAILFTGWLLENVGITSVTPELALRVILLLGLGFVILLFVPPFHYWLPSVARSVNPYALAFVAIILQSSGMFILLRFLDSFAWMRADARILLALQAAGILMIAFGGVVVITQTSFLKLIAYAFLADIGVTLLALGSDPAVGTEVAIGLTSIRAISLALWGLGAAMMSNTGYSSGAGRVAPVATVAALVGLMSLAGLPMTAGYPWRWALLTEASGVPAAGALLMVLSMFAILWAGMRWAGILFGIESEEAQEQESLQRRFAAALMGGACVLLGIFPQLALPWVALATSGLANLSP